jgi:two-component system phosphate regulon sensor histidine kinase PhoR
MTGRKNDPQTTDVPPVLPCLQRFLRSLAFIILPLGVVLGGLAANTDVSPRTALLFWVGLSLIVALVLRGHLRREWVATNENPAIVRNPESDNAVVTDAILGTILHEVDMPILLIGNDRRVLFQNRAAVEMFSGSATGNDLSTAIRDPEVLVAADRVIDGGTATTVEFRQNQPVNRLLRARIERLAPPRNTGDRPSFIIMLDDVTDDERMREVRSGFVADVSHELRTPLAAVLSIVETLNGAAREDPAAQARFMVMLDEQARRMSGIVDDLLSLSRVEMNEHRPPDGTSELHEVIVSAAASASLIAAERNVRIIVEGEPQVAVSGDGLELSRVFQNLIDNAVKYGDADTAVTVTLEKRDRTAVISVADRGPGIPREHIPRLTERFYRVDKGRSRAAGGTGLGLAIVKHVVSRHRGRLKIDSTVGEGSTFTVELPLADAN